MFSMLLLGGATAPFNPNREAQMLPQVKDYHRGENKCVPINKLSCAKTLIGQ